MTRTPSSAAVDRAAWQPLTATTLIAADYALTTIATASPLFVWGVVGIAEHEKALRVRL